MSGRPFSIIDTNIDPDRNGILFDPLPAGTYTGVGEPAITVENSGGRNGAYGPTIFNWMQGRLPSPDASVPDTRSVRRVLQPH